MGGSVGTRLIWIVYIGILLGTAVHILLHKHESRSAALWLMVVTTLPGLGLFLYLMFGVDRVARKALLKEAANLRLRQEYVASLPRSEAVYEYPRDAEAGLEREGSLEFPAVLERICDRPLVVGNRVRLMTLGDRVYQHMLESIEKARRHIHIQTYIFLSDKVGRQFVEILVRKAVEGVEVRLLYDPVGSIDALWFLDELANSRVKVRPFTPLNPLKRRWQLNLRNHRKLLLVDGVVAFTGGMNITEMHLIDHPLLTRAKDYHFQVEGPVVHQMQEWFVEDWHYACGEKLLSGDIFPPLRWEGDDLARVITSGPDGDYEAFYKVVFAAITGAESRIVIVTPYFIPDKGLLTALQLAAAKGVEITLVVPGHSDHPFVTWAARTFYEDLLSFGIRIYERRAPFLHAKVLVVDDVWAIVGSANMDVRSFRLNFEANLEVRSPTLIRALLAAVQDEIQHARLVDLATFRNRPLGVRVLESACALFNPLL